MSEFSLSNSAGRDAVVNAESVRAQRKVRWLDPQGRQAANVRFIKSTVDRDIDALADHMGGLSKVGQALIQGDPEIDAETMGRFLRTSSRVYVNPCREIVHKVQPWEIVRNPDGSQRERRPRKSLRQNVSGDVPLRWSGVLIEKSKACRRFVFSSKLQLTHINGLTYDFLYGIAKELEEKESLLLLGAGPKANQPLILRHGGTPYRGFLEGRTQGDRYCLLLHLSNLELKAPTETHAEEPAA